MYKYKPQPELWTIKGNRFFIKARTDLVCTLMDNSYSCELKKNLKYDETVLFLQ